ncbi:MAG: hypothetical protein ACRETL_02480 [Gammaproteobacteria bacterium]
MADDERFRTAASAVYAGVKQKLNAAALEVCGMPFATIKHR